jgi:Protein of unknown function (DUF4231)
MIRRNATLPSGMPPDTKSTPAPFDGDAWPNFYLTLSTATLSASTTALIGAKEVTQAAWLTILALVCSAAVTVAAAYDGFLRSKDLWISNNETLTSLKALKATIAYAEAKAAESLTQTEVGEFYKSFDTIIGTANSSWEAFRQKAGANA